MNKISLSTLALFLFSMLSAQGASAEQFFMVGSTQAHYVVLNTMFLQPNIAEQYQITRGNDRAIVNISFISKDGIALQGVVRGRVKNLLGQLQTLDFREIVEKNAVYYIATLIYTNRDTLGFEIDVELPGESKTHYEFQERMYLDTDR